MTRRKIEARFALIACVSVGLGMSAVSKVHGQYTTSGMFGSRTMGSTLSGRGNNLATAGRPGSRLDQQENIGQITGTERFLRDARQPGQFVGADSAETSFVGAMSSGGYSTTGTGLGGLGGRGLSGLGGRGMGGLGGGLYGTSGMGLLGTSGIGGMNRRGTGQLGSQRGANRTGAAGRMGAFGGMGGGRRNITLQTQMTVDFRYSQLPTAKIRSTVERRLNSSARIQKLGPIQFEVEGRTATLRGVVAREEDRQLVLRMVKLEPGISEVLDELSVASQDAPIPTESPNR